MHIYAIGDLHFSGVPETKPMTVFGEHWQHHRQRIMENWKQTVMPEDLVIICGDISGSGHSSRERPDIAQH